MFYCAAAARRLNPEEWSEATISGEDSSFGVRACTDEDDTRDKNTGGHPSNEPDAVVNAEDHHRLVTRLDRSNGGRHVPSTPVIVEQAQPTACGGAGLESV